jgi:3-hydroxybutyryl-CoA dehydrogenase
MPIKSVLVIGAGTMGRGIAQWFTQQGLTVELLDNNPDVTKTALEAVFSSWDKLEAKGKFTSDQVSTFKSSLTAATFESFNKDCSLVVEAIVESLEIKTKVFKELDSLCSKETILASNTSSIPISSLAKELSESRREKFIGLHFFNPAPIMKLVEIIKGHWSDKKIIEDYATWFEDKGKKVAICNDSPGFIVNRVARNFYGEAMRVVSHYDQEKIKEVDSVLKQCGGFRMGPFELMDLIGIDVNYSVTQSVWESYYRDPRFAPHLLQKQMVDSGRIGKKSKGGFYDYE